MYPFAFIPAGHRNAHIVVVGNVYIAITDDFSWFCESLLELDIRTFNMNNDYQL